MDDEGGGKSTTPAGGATSSLKLLRRLQLPLYRRDIWPFVLVIYPLLTWLTISTWESWHPSSHAVLSSTIANDLYTPTSPILHFCPFVKSIFDAAIQIPPGVPGLFPLDELPVALIDPLLQSNNFALLLYAAWGLAVLLQVLSFLLPTWHYGYAAWALYQEVSSLEDATHILVRCPSRKATFCPLQTGHRLANSSTNHDSLIDQARIIKYFQKTFHVLYADQIQQKTPQLQKRLNKYKSVGKSSLRPIALFPLQYDMNRPLKFYKHTLEEGGLQSNKIINDRLLVFGKNEQNIPIPSFIELFEEHAKAPLFVFQMFCLVLWLVDEYWQYSMMTLVMLVAFEGQMVHRRRKDLAMIQGMHMAPVPVAVRRLGKWWVISSVDILPGDIFSLVMGREVLDLPPFPSASGIPRSRFTGDNQSLPCPCDCLVLKGTAIVDEAMLTGESLPQLKSAIDLKESPDRLLEMSGAHKMSCLFAGTSVLAEQGSEGDRDGCATDEIGGAILYCIRTGFQTTQGKLIRTVLHSSERATAASKEALYFLAVLMVVAVLASSYVLLKSWGLSNRNHFKLLLHCIMIVTAVVPPELPVTMSLTVTLALTGLFKKKLYCTEPFRIPYAGKLSICCFDKTGTLTASDVCLEAIAGLAKEAKSKLSPAQWDDSSNFYTTPSALVDEKAAGKSSSQAEEAITLNLTPDSLKVIAACHSLVAIAKRHKLPLAMRAGAKREDREIQILGDPLEKAALKFTQWKPEINSTSKLTGPSGHTAIILRRFPFASEHRRMTVVAQFNYFGNNQKSNYVLCKGAAEKLMDLYQHTPAWLPSLVRDMALKGRRVLALGISEWEKSEDEAKTATRSTIEQGLRFAGLMIFGCPIKPKTADTLSVLRDSGHLLVMITGDDPRTADHIALETGLLPPNKTIYHLQSVKESSPDHYVMQLRSRDDTSTDTIEYHHEDPKKRCEDSWFQRNALTLTGSDLTAIRNENLLKWIIPRTPIYARVTPRDKEMILRVLASVGHTTLMCGDGTNDVGALKAANVGISLLNFDIDKIKKNKKQQLAAAKDMDNISWEDPEQSRKRRLDLGLTAKQIASLEKLETSFKTQHQALVFLGDTFQKKFISTWKKQLAQAEENYAQANLARAAGHQPAASTSMFGGPGGGASQSPFDALDEEMPLLKPGDASMASPFSYRGQNIKCVKLLIRSGKATLATVMMLYKLMALNSLTTAFALSVLTLNGVKFGDVQSTIESIAVSILFMAASNAKSAKTLTADRVIDSLFDKFFYSSIILQSLVHISTCSIGWYMASFYTSASQKMDGPFKPNLVNTVIFLTSAAQHAASFTANYEGSPFLISIRENHVLGKGLIVFLGCLFFLTLEVSPSVNSLLKLVPFPTPSFRYAMAILMASDLALSTFIGRVLTRLGRSRMQDHQRNWLTHVSHTSPCPK